MAKDKIHLTLSKTARRQLEFIKESINFENDGEVIFAGLHAMYKLAKSDKDKGIGLIKRRGE